MTVRRRLVVIVASLVMVTVGCGVASVAAPAPSEGANVAPPAAAGSTASGRDSIRPGRAVVDATTAPTTTARTTTARTTEAPTSTLARGTRRGRVGSRTAAAGRTAGAVGKPEHLRKHTAEPVQEPVAVSPALTDPVPSPSESPPVADPPPASATLTVTVTTTPPPADTAAPAAPTAPPAENPVGTTVAATEVAVVAPPVEDAGSAGQFAAAINGLRAEVGVGSLSRSGDLDARALAWAQYMAGASDLSHSGSVSQLVAEGWSIAGENVGYGPSVDAVFAGLLGSSGHYANMVNPSFTTVGVGAVVDADGVVWTAHLFAG